jgi:hypothetical protein
MKNLLLSVLFLVIGCDDYVMKDDLPEQETDIIIKTISFQSYYAYVDSDEFEYNYNMPEIDSEVMDNGFVIAYLEADGGDNIHSLPLTLGMDSDDNYSVEATLTVGYNYKVGEFGLHGMYSMETDASYMEEIAEIFEGPYRVIIVKNSELSRSYSSSFKNIINEMNILSEEESIEYFRGLMQREND